MTDGTAPTVDQRTPAVGRQSGELPARPARPRRLRHQRRDQAVPGSRARARRHRQRPADLRAGAVQPLRRPGLRGVQVGATRCGPDALRPGNDGMLHAFYAGINSADPLGGKEAWAVIPSTVLPKLYRLADNNYKDSHAVLRRRHARRSATLSRRRLGHDWRTILVGRPEQRRQGLLRARRHRSARAQGRCGSSSGARPSAPGRPATPRSARAVGNTSDCHLGQTYGRPLITKLADGTWVVMVTSGYNNVNAPNQAGDGGGYLYVLNASTGEIIHKIPHRRPAHATTPSGLAQINGFADNAEINNTDAAGLRRRRARQHLALRLQRQPQPRDGSDAARHGEGQRRHAAADHHPAGAQRQARRQADACSSAPGKLLGATDVADLQMQSVYGIVDPMSGSPSYPEPAQRAGAAHPDAGRQRCRHLPDRRLRRHGRAMRGARRLGGQSPGSGRAGERGDEAALGHPGRRQQRAADQRLRHRRLQLAELLQLP